MKHAVISVCVCTVLATLGGCHEKWPFTWKPTEAIRANQGLVVDNLAEMKDYVDTSGEVHRKEALGAAKAVEGYLGPAKVRLQPIQPINMETIRQGQADASRPAPTISEVIGELPDEAERSVLPWVDMGITLLLAFGATGAAATALRYRKKAVTALDAFRETVRGVESGKAVLSDSQAEKLLTELAKAQSTPAKALVEKVKVGQGL